MDAGTTAAIIGGALITVVSTVYVLVRLFKAPPRPFNGETKEILAVLREIRDRMVSQSYEQSKVYDCAVRVEQSQIALHRRFDALVGPRE